MVQNPRSPLVFSFAAPPDPGVAEAIASVPGVEVVVHPGLRGPELAAAARGADVLIVRSWQRATREVLAAGAGRLAAVVQASAGLDNIDHDAAAELGVRVVGVDPGNATSVAELTLLSLLALFRNVRGYWAGGGVAAWPDRETLRDREIRRKTLGLVGLGRVGSRVARRAAAFEMRVLAYDPYLADADFAARGAERIRSLDEMLPLLDALSLHCPLTDETRGMIDARRLDLLPRGAVVVNTARGAVLDLPAVVRALDAGRLHGAAIDVWPEEPPPAGAAAPRHPKILPTPHLAGHTAESHRERAENMIAALGRLAAERRGTGR